MKLFAFMFLLTAQVTVAQKIPIPITNGISLQLAEYRQRVLSGVNYELSFSIPLRQNESIAASEVLSFELKANSAPLHVDFKEKSDHLFAVVVNGIKINAPLVKEHIVIETKYLHLGRNRIGFEFIAGELSLNRNSEYLYTLLVPDRSRTTFPCFDQPGIKARFRLALTTPKEWKVVGNAGIETTTDASECRKYVFKESELFSTYLFAFVAGKFEMAEKQEGKRPMKFYYRETDTNKIRLSIDTIFGIHRKAIDFLEAYTRIPFPFQKLDFVAIPDFQYGGMEHVGAIDYKASTLFLDSGATQDQRNGRANVIAHETSHMWFGDLVTMQWFNDVWMKEVFANFMADKITQGAEANNSYELKFLLTHYPRAYAVDRTEGANPIRQVLPNLDQAGSLYGAIIYDKAPIMMRQLERLMGAEAFRDGLREYLKKYSYGNATWPDLIRILDKRTPEDLEAWNRVWVNTPGRPVLNYTLEQKGGLISQLVITQKGEHTTGYLLPQFFKVALVYSDHIEQFDVNMKGPSVEVDKAKGKQLPLYILCNSSGEGYGLFPVDKNMIGHIEQCEDPVMRGSAYINLYENMLAGTGITPTELMNLYLPLLSKETEELNINLVAGQLSDIYWHYLKATERNQVAPTMATTIWTAMNEQRVAGKKKILFRTYQSIALMPASLDTLYRIWKDQRPPGGIKLSEDEYTSLALSLAVKDYPDDSILQVQLSRLTNTDRKQRLQFLIPAASRDQKTRDAFFASLKELSVRKKEAWVADALSYLHHPLRTKSSIRYLQASLDMLEEIQRTNDIFFPGTWMNASLGSYQSREAASIVRNFLKTHPGYNPQLRMKILQAADPLFRAEKLLNR
jgi:aminopeptidase N